MKLRMNWRSQRRRIGRIRASWEGLYAAVEEASEAEAPLYWIAVVEIVSKEEETVLDREDVCPY